MTKISRRTFGGLVMGAAVAGTGVRASVVHPGPTMTSMGWSLPAEKIGPALEDWAKWGQARHSYFLRAADLARAITFVAETPRGGFIANMELQPEAPLAEAKDRQSLALGEEGMPSPADARSNENK